jgi:hypothetical protein
MSSPLFDIWNGWDFANLSEHASAFFRLTPTHQKYSAQQKAALLARLSIEIIQLKISAIRPW